jgi:hypothetical protein
VARVPLRGTRLQNFDENPNTRPGGTPEEQALPSNRAEGAMTLKRPAGPLLQNFCFTFFRIFWSLSFAYSTFHSAKPLFTPFSEGRSCLKQQKLWKFSPCLKQYLYIFTTYYSILMLFETRPNSTPERATVNQISSVPSAQSAEE